MKGINRYKYSDFNFFATLNGRTLNKIPGDGLCLLNTFKSCFLHDFGEIIHLDDVKSGVSRFLTANSEKYTQYHEGDPNALLDHLHFFYEEESHVQSDICDFLIKILADCFEVNINMFQKGPDEEIELLSFGPEAAHRQIWIRFYRDPVNPAGNHYDSVVITSFCKGKNLVDIPEDDEEEDITLTPNPSQPSFMSSSQSGNEGENKNDPNEEILDDMVKWERGIPFPTHLYLDEPLEVESIPPNINGLKLYKVKASINTYNAKTTDRHWFRMRTSSCSGLNGKRKTGKCHGSYICNNPECSYLATEGKKNTTSFENILH